MPFPLPLAIAIYFTIWWITLIAILPFWVRSADESGEERPPGHDPGAPVTPHLARKAAVTTVVAAAVFGVVVLVVKYLF